MATDTALIMQSYVFPAMRTILWLVLGLGSTIGFGYWLLVVQRRRKWYVSIWEQKADGHLQLITKDVLYEKIVNKGKQTVYLLRRQRQECFPPPWEATYRVRGKEYVDYLRIREDYVPFQRVLNGVKNLPEDKANIIQTIKDKLLTIRKTNKKQTEKDYIFAPINQTMNFEVGFEPMDYDVNMMRINAIDVRDKIYADKMDFLQKYGTFIAFGMIIVLIIVVLYLSYDYSGNVISAAMGKASETLNAVEALATKMGGVPPPS